MPTTIVRCPELDEPHRRRIAKELTFFWRRAGVTPAHVITRFEPPGSVYSGPFPLELPYAFVSCVVAQDRDDEFKAGYAEQLRRSFAALVPAERVFVSFFPTDPRDHYVPEARASAEEGTAR
ncbi:hypothetical protein ACFVYA_27700 [Amycolatopsis sp. NPDC058278]|jgi:hypothetical protein|uniref:hypothetical protein n=1 Tax=unclassified Amycolatopsis TaxID=2618356 RepID=UPI00255C1EA1|nr:hypothetical protein [Amycolatopsis sp. DG1A-15b]WIX91447.1 hypothetical protein QRY02_13845 [Amycolatopsis sp. DG1A-15b]